MKKTKFLVVSALLAIILVGCGPSVENVNKSLEQGDYVAAVRDYKELSTEEQTELTDKFKLEADEIKNDFIKEQIDKVTAIEALTEIKMISGMEDIASQAMEDINNIDNSRVAFAAATTAEESEDWEKAIKEYSKVVAIDVKNYDVAQVKITDISKKLEDSIPVIVESVKVRASESQYKALYPDQLQVLVNNKSDQAIKNMQIGFLAWDQNNLPITVKSQFSFNPSFEFIGNAENINVTAGSTFGNGVGWDLDENHGIVTVKANVKTVEFYDGTTWNNPLYDGWIAQYKEKQLSN